MNVKPNTTEFFDVEDAMEDLVGPDGSVPILEPDFDFDTDDVIGSAFEDASFSLALE